MLHNDISNQRSFTIGFRCEESLLHYKDSNLIEDIKNTFFGKTKRAEIDKKVYSLMNYLYWNTEYTVLLVIDKENYTKEAEEFLSDFPFNQVTTIIDNVSEITMMLNTGEMTYFVSEDLLDRNRVNSKFAVDVDTMNTLIKRRIKRFEETQTV